MLSHLISGVRKASRKHAQRSSKVGRGLSQRGRSLRLEPLEERRLLAVACVLSDGELAVIGTDKADTIDIRQIGDNLQVNFVTRDGGRLIDRGEKTFNASLVNSIVVNGAEGDDTIRISDPSAVDRYQIFLIGGPGNDVIESNRANATLIGGAGTDTLAGREAVITIDYRTSPAGVVVDLLRGVVPQDGFGSADYLCGVKNIEGSYFSDNLRGDRQDNRIDGWDGNDTIYGEAGNDELWGLGGADSIYGNEGDDHIHGGEGDDVRLDGGPGSDTIYGDGGNDLLVGGEDGENDVDYLYGGSGDDTLYGGGGADKLYGEKGSDLLCGESGDDYLDAGLNSENEHDSLSGGSGNDKLWGGGGDDDLYGDAGTDELYGESGNDKLVGGLDSENEHDLLSGGEGNDTLWGGGGDDNLYGAAGDDTLHGGPGNDYLDGGDDSEIETDHLYGDAGDDVLWGGGGADQLHGGPDSDTLHGESGNDYLKGGEDSEGDPDFLYGGTGDDVLWGGGGEDKVVGDAGADQLHGGPGRDYLCYDAADTVVDGTPEDIRGLGTCAASSPMYGDFPNVLPAQDLTPAHKALFDDTYLQIREQFISQFLCQSADGAAMVPDWITEISSPAAAPTVDPVNGGLLGGLLQPGTYTARYTFVDYSGGETLAGPSSAPFTISRITDPAITPLIDVTGGGVTGGGLQAGTYYAFYTYVDAWTGETLKSPSSAVFTVAAGNIPRVTIPAPLPPGAAGFNLYLTLAGGAPASATLYSERVLGTTVDLTLPHAAGKRALPAANTSSMGNVPLLTIAEAGLPTGAKGFKVYIKSASGAAGAETLYGRNDGTGSMNLAAAFLGGAALPNRNNSAAKYHFGDQGIDMGYALLTFATEARIFSQAGLDPGPAEWVINRLLRGFEDMDKLATMLAGLPDEPGFFYRDAVSAADRRYGIPGSLLDANSPKIESDLMSSLADVAKNREGIAGGDQIIYLMNGWWGVKEWSTNSQNRDQAVSQTRRVMDYLDRHRMKVEIPGTDEVVNEERGGDVRGIGAFLGVMAGRICENDYSDTRVVLPVTTADLGNLVLNAMTAYAATQLDLGSAAIAVVIHASGVLGRFDKPICIPVSTVRDLFLSLDNVQLLRAYTDGKLETTIPLGDILGEAVSLDFVHQVTKSVREEVEKYGILGKVVGTVVQWVDKLIDVSDVIDFSGLNIPVTIPIPRYKANPQPYMIHMALDLMATDGHWSAADLAPQANDYLDPWVMLLRQAINGGDINGRHDSLISDQLQDFYGEVPPEGPNSNAGNRWAFDNRWERNIADVPDPEFPRQRSNGLDFLSMAGMAAMMKLYEISPMSLTGDASVLPTAPAAPAINA